MCDQLRAFEVGCYGNAAARTPHLDALALQGARFGTAVSNNPVCMPARSVVLSGQYSRTCASISNRQTTAPDGTVRMTQYPQAGSPDFPDATLPELLRDAGYHTAAIGKWHVHSHPLDIGFDYSLIPRNYHCHSDQYFFENRGAEFRAEGFSPEFEAQQVGGYLAGRRQQTEPFFLYYNISPPHMPICDAPDKYLSMHDPADMPLRPNVWRDGKLLHDEHWFRVYRWDYRYYHEDRPHTHALPEGFDLRHLIALYYGVTTWVDDILNSLLRHLRENCLTDDTIVLFTSDHGDMLGSHHLMNKGQLLEESIRIPLIARWPGRIGPASHDRQVASLVDLAPTLLELADVAPPGHMQGESLAACMRGSATEAGPKRAFIETSSDGVGVRSRTQLLGIPWQDGSHRKLADRPHRVHDLLVDPFQMNKARVVDGELEPALRQWHASTPWRDDQRSASV